MIILSQDKKSTVNYDNCFKLAINGTDEKLKEKSIKITATGNVSHCILGQYETEERAKEVLQEIIRSYKLCNRCQNGEEIWCYSNGVFTMPEK